MHNITQCIREHQAHVSNAQNIRNNEMSDLQAKYDGILQVIDEFKNGIKDTYRPCNPSCLAGEDTIKNIYNTSYKKADM